MNIPSKIRAGVASAALAAVVVGGVAVASSNGDERPSLEQTTIGGEAEQTVESTVAPTTAAPVTAPPETTEAPATTATPITTAAPTTTTPAVEMVVVPATVGLSEGTARQALEGAGFVVSVIYVDLDDATTGKRVVEMSPHGNGTATAPAGSTVSITVDCDCQP